MNDSTSPETPTPADCYRRLKSRWDAGDRDRVLGCELMFYAWYCAGEPEHITGFSGTWIDNWNKLMPVFHEVHGEFKWIIRNDPEMLFVAGIIGSIDGYMFDDAGLWELLTEDYRRRYRELCPNGLDPAVLANRGEYGDYLTMQLNVAGGF